MFASTPRIVKLSRIDDEGILCSEEQVEQHVKLHNVPTNHCVSTSRAKDMRGACAIPFVDRVDRYNTYKIVM